MPEHTMTFRVQFSLKDEKRLFFKNEEKKKNMKTFCSCQERVSGAREDGCGEEGIRALASHSIRTPYLRDDVRKYPRKTPKNKNRFFYDLQFYEFNKIN